MARKKRRNIFPLVIILLIIGILIYVSFFTEIFTQTFGGGTVLSVSNIQTISSAPELNNQEAFLVNIVANQGGESLTGEIETESGPFKIELNLKESSCQYQIIDDQFTVGKIYQATGRDGLAGGGCLGASENAGLARACPYSSVDLNDVIANCEGNYKRPALYTNEPGTNINNGNPCTNFESNECQPIPHVPEFCNIDFEPSGTEKPWLGAPPIGDPCSDIIDFQPSPQFSPEQSEWCYAMPGELLTSTGDRNHWRVTHIGTNPWYQGFRIDTASFPQFEVEVRVTNGEGEIASTTITNTEQLQIVDDIMRVKFAGSLLAQQSCPIPSINENIVKDIRTDEFKSIRRTDYEAYKDNFIELLNLDNNFFANAGFDPGVGASDITSRMSSLNTFLRSMVEDISSGKNCKIEGLQYNCRTQAEVVYPELQLLIRADWIGVIIPSGIPLITDIDVPKAFEGDLNELGFTIKNIGEEDDSFDVTATCGADDIAVSSKRIPLAIGESATDSLPVNGQAGTLKCTLKVISTNNPFNLDTQDFTITFREKELAQLNPFSDLFTTKEGKLNIWLIIGLIITVLLIVSLIIFNKKIFKKRRR